MKFSLFVINFNKEVEVLTAIKSALDQTYKDIEVICVDDNSTDNSVACINEAFGNDDRFKLVCHDENKSLYMARISAIMAATGDYCMFLDNDDEYKPDACEKLFNVLSKNDYDIVGYNVDICPCGDARAELIDSAKRYFSPMLGAASGEELFEATFVNRQYTYSMVTKCFKVSMLKEACKKARKIYSNYNEDYAFSILALSLAKRYTGIPDELIKYNYGIGISTSPYNSLEAAKKKIDFSFASNSVSKEHLHYYKNEPRYDEALMYHEKELIGDMFTIVSRCPNGDMKEAFSYLKDVFGEKLVLDTLLMNGLMAHNEMLRFVDMDKYYPVDKKEIKTIGVYYGDELDNAYKEKADQVQGILKESGYKVVRIMDDPDIVKGDEVSDRTYYKKRYVSFKNVVSKNNIDLVIYHSFFGNDIYRDLCAAKAANSYFAVNTYGTVNAYGPDTLQFLLRCYSVFGCADAVVNDNEPDSVFWNNVSEKYIRIDDGCPMDSWNEIMNVIAGKQEYSPVFPKDKNTFLYKFKSMLEILIDQKNRITIDRESKIFVTVNSKSYKMTKKMVSAVKKILRR